MEMIKIPLMLFAVLVGSLMVYPQPSQSAKILVIAQYYHSHAHVVAAIGDELHQRGHTVVMVTASAIHFRPEKKYKIMYYKTPVTQDDLANCMGEALKNNDNLLLPCHKYGNIDLAAFSHERKLLEDIRQQNFDGVLCDIISPICQIIVQAADIEVLVDVAAVGFGDPFISGPFHIPNPLAYIPQLGYAATNKMTLYQRTINVIIYYVATVVAHTLILPKMYDAMNVTNLGLNFTPVFADRKSSFLIVNTDFAIDYPRPITPTAKVVGPILPKPSQPLPDDLQQIVSSNPKGTILVSFGSVVTALKYVTDINMLFDTFGKLPYTVIWKYIEDVPQNIAPNIKIVKWLPQNDLLGHPNIKAFVTHCGMNSLLEAAYHGVPMVGIPVAGDQVIHAEKIAAKNVGVVLNVKKMKQHDLHYAIMNVTTRQDIIGNATRVSKLIKNRPNGRTPVQEAGDWMEYALNCGGGDYLRTEEYNLSWHQLYLLDVYAVLLIISVLLYKLIRLILRGICSLCCSKTDKVKKS